MTASAPGPAPAAVDRGTRRRRALVLAFASLLVALAVVGVLVVASRVSGAEAADGPAPVATSAGAASAGAGAVAAPVAGSPADPASAPAEGQPVALAPIVAAWPEAYTVTGTKSEPLYVEHITSTRTGAAFSVTIDVVAQGDSPLGTQNSQVELGADGSIRWTGGCTKPAAECADDPALRGFLSEAAVLSAARRGFLPAEGVARTLHGHPVVCVSDAALHPDAPPAVASLDPCFSMSTGALLGHWSSASSAFVGPTLAEGLVDRAG
ncbi:hypothetical protein VD659_14555 [Herbiconiux sp. 11R-BC]|uniref:hypothetical protein n=1 Tax=Herbiconiux sp. 11R-BC TaxID=3111637 RepID=UPI003C004A1E